MKWIIGIFFLASCTVVIGVQPCTSEEDCSKDECCATMSPKDLKRGVCRKLGNQRDMCSMKEEKLTKYGGKYVRACPCRDGLSCKFRRGISKELVIGPVAIFLQKCQMASPSEKAGGSEAKEIVYEEIFDENGKVIAEEILDTPL